MNGSTNFSSRRSLLFGAGVGTASIIVAHAARAVAQAAEADAKEPAADFANPAGVQAYRTATPRRPIWPDDAKMVVCITVHTDGSGGSIGRGMTPLGAQGGGRYSTRRGTERALEVLAANDIKGTFMVPAYDALVKPALFRSVYRAGHEICGHGYYHIPGDGALAVLERGHKILTEICDGDSPVGWCNPGGSKNHDTLATLKRLGYRYDASEKDDDQPYLVEIAGQVQADFIELPNNTRTIDDAPQYATGMQSPSEVLDEWVGELEAIYATSGYYHLCYHPTAVSSGPAERALIVDKLIKKAKSMHGVRFVRLRDLADHCLRTPGKFQLARGQNL